MVRFLHPNSLPWPMTYTPRPRNYELSVLQMHEGYYIYVAIEARATKWELELQSEGK